MVWSQQSEQFRMPFVLNRGIRTPTCDYHQKTTTLEEGKDTAVAPVFVQV